MIRVRAKSAFVLYFCLFLLVMPAHAAKTDEDASVLSFVVADDEPTIIDRLLNAAFRRIGYDIAVDAGGMSVVEQMADSGEYAGLGSQLAGIEKTCRNLVRVEESIGKVKFEVYALKESAFEVDSWRALRGLRVGTLLYKPYIESRLPENVAKRVKKRSIFDLIESLERGECDVLVVSNSLPVDIPTPPGVRKIGLVGSADSYPYLNVAYADLAPQVAGALRAMKEDGTYERIVNQLPEPSRRTKTVLCITSYSRDDIWEKMLYDGIVGTISKRSDVVWFATALDMNRILSDAGRANKVFNTIRTSYLSQPPDVVIAMDVGAIMFSMDYYHVLFGNAPIVLCGITGEEACTPWKFYYNCVRLTGEVPAVENVNMIRDLYPDTKEVFVINDYSDAGLAWRAQISRDIGSSLNGIRIAYNDDLPLDDLMRQIEKLRAGTVVLFGHYYVDGKKLYYSQQEIQEQMRKHNSVPVFGMMGGGIGYGQIGGKYVNPFQYGEAAAGAALSILDAGGIPGGAGQGETGSLNSWIFDGNELQRRHIGLARLPADSSVINRRLSMYEENPEFFVLLCVLFFMTFVIIAVLSLMVSILRRSNRRLLNMQKDLHTAEELLDKDEEIRGIKERLEIALAASSSGVWEIGLSEGIVRYDKVTEDIFGFDLGGSMTIEKFVDRMNEIVVDVEEPGFYREMLSNEPRGSDIEREMVILSPDGSERYLNAHLRVLSDEEGRAEKVIGMLIDVTSQTEMERELRDAKEAAEAANKAKSYFLSIISHEIRTPMNAIIGMSELLLAERLTEDQAKYLKDIQTASTSLLGIINDILDISKIDAGRFQLVPAHFDFNELLSNLYTMFSFAAEEKGISFLLDAKERLPRYLYGDDVRIRQILVNVVGNGIKFTEKGYVLLEISASSDTLRFDISDSGIGVKEENIGRLFNSFDQFDQDKNRKIEGTGLGLAITKNLVDLMGGSIGVESRYGEGTTFRIEIPLVEGDGNRLVGENGETPFVYAASAKVLVVDDNEINLNVAVGMLRLHRIVADRALSGREALEKIGETEYDLVLMDHMMPEMDGVEATRAIREAGNAALPVVALTANAVEGVREELIASGMDDYLAKPIKSSQLNVILAKWLPPAKVAYEAGGRGEAGERESGRLIERIGELPEIDLELGLGRIGGMVDVYGESLEIMVRKLPESIARLAFFLEAGDMKNYTILVHGTKGSLDNIGATELASRARGLEAAARGGDVNFCRERTQPFLDELRALHEKLAAILGAEKRTKDVRKESGSLETLMERSAEIRTLLLSFLDVEAAGIVRELQKSSYGHDFDEKLEELLNFILEFDYDGAIELIDRLSKEE